MFSLKFICYDFSPNNSPEFVSVIVILDYNSLSGSFSVFNQIIMLLTLTSNKHLKKLNLMQLSIMKLKLLNLNCNKKKSGGFIKSN